MLLLRSIDRIIKALLIFVVKSYQVAISPMFKPQCRFTPSCSNYALETLKKKPAYIAAYMILFRIIKCNPLHPGGHDPVG